MFRMKEFINGDCMDHLSFYPDEHFDLAIIDPEYRDENQPTQQMRAKGDMNKWQGKSDPEYFTELFRISKHQIIWGGNYYASILPENNNWIVWHKNNAGTGFSMCELAWCSIRKNIQLFYLRAPQTLQQENRIHPTQKPIKLYHWLLNNYAEKHFKILSTHVGSASDLIAFEDFGCDYVGYEIDKDYYDSALKRLNEHKAQLTIFS